MTNSLKHPLYILVLSLNFSRPQLPLFLPKSSINCQVSLFLQPSLQASFPFFPTHLQQKHLDVLSNLKLLVQWRTQCSACVNHSVVSDSLPPHRVRFLCPWDSPGKNSGDSCHSLLQGILQTKGTNLCFLHCSQILYHLSHHRSLKGSPSREIFKMGNVYIARKPQKSCLMQKRYSGEERCSNKMIYTYISIIKSVSNMFLLSKHLELFTFRNVGILQKQGVSKALGSRSRPSSSSPMYLNI